MILVFPVGVDDFVMTPFVFVMTVFMLDPMRTGIGNDCDRCRGWVGFRIRHHDDIAHEAGSIQPNGRKRKSPVRGVDGALSPGE
jgi:hypothetical protein